MKLLATLLGVSSASTSLSILKSQLRGKTLPKIPDTEYSAIQEGDDLTFTAQVVQASIPKDILRENLFSTISIDKG